MPTMDDIQQNFLKEKKTTIHNAKDSMTEKPDGSFSYTRIILNERVQTVYSLHETLCHHFQHNPFFRFAYQTITHIENACTYQGYTIGFLSVDNEELEISVSYFPVESVFIEVGKRQVHSVRGYQLQRLSHEQITEEMAAWRDEVEKVILSFHELRLLTITGALEISHLT